MTADATALDPRTTPTRRQPTSHGAGGIGNPVLGMLLFITSEVMFFAGLFAAYFSLRAGYTEIVGGVPHVWPPTEFADLLNPFTLVTENGQLNLILPATIILVALVVHLPAGRVGDPARRPPRVRAQHRGDARPGHHLPAASRRSTTAS